MPAFSHCFLKRRMALSIGSFSLTRTPAMHHSPPPTLGMNARHANSICYSNVGASNFASLVLLQVESSYVSMDSAHRDSAHTDLRKALGKVTYDAVHPLLHQCAHHCNVIDRPREHFG